jgi:hypothetical protein
VHQESGNSRVHATAAVCVLDNRLHEQRGFIDLQAGKQPLCSNSTQACCCAGEVVAGIATVRRFTLAGRVRNNR